MHIYFRRSVNTVFWKTLKKGLLETSRGIVQRPLSAPYSYSLTSLGAVHMLLIKPHGLPGVPCGMAWPGGLLKLTTGFQKAMSEGRFPGNAWFISELPFCSAKCHTRHGTSQHCWFCYGNNRYQHLSGLQLPKCISCSRCMCTHTVGQLWLCSYRLRLRIH